MPGYLLAGADYGTKNIDNGVEGEDSHQNVNTDEKKRSSLFYSLLCLKLANLHQVTFMCRGQMTLIPLKTRIE